MAQSLTIDLAEPPATTAPSATGVDFEPILNIHSGQTMGVILQVRSIGAALAGIDAFRASPIADHSRLFVRFPGPLTGIEDFARKVMAKLTQCGFEAGRGRLLISSRLDPMLSEELPDISEELRRLGLPVAVDDFGMGFTGVRMLSGRRVDYVLIAPALVRGLSQDKDRQAIVSSLLNAAHACGVSVAALGIDNDKDFYVARDLGFDFAAGTALAGITGQTRGLQPGYTTIADINARDRRRESGDRRRIQELLDAIEPIPLSAPILDVVARFREDKHSIVAPVIDQAGMPVGIIRDSDLKEYLYSPFGHGLLANKSIGGNLARFLSPCPTIDVHSGIDRIVKRFSDNDGSLGIIITTDGFYTGFLSARSLLRIINERNVAAARDQNPLTKLPGNTRIFEYVSEALIDTDSAITLAYFDFDNFKPFNDTYGFRLGDRAILMFAEMLSTAVPSGSGLAGHIGGDDFFLAVEGLAWNVVHPVLRDLAEKFRSDAESLYDQEARERGYIEAKDRFGVERRFPLLSVSGAVIELPAGRPVIAFDDVVAEIAAAKAEAKHAPDHIHRILMPAGR